PAGDPRQRDPAQPPRGTAARRPPAGARGVEPDPGPAQTVASRARPGGTRPRGSGRRRAAACRGDGRTGLAPDRPLAGGDAVRARVPGPGARLAAPARAPAAAAGPRAP